MIQQSPKALVIGRIAELAKAFARPDSLIAVERDDSIRQPGAIAGQGFAIERSHADAAQQFPADSARLEVDQRGRADVEGKARAAKEAAQPPADHAPRTQWWTIRMPEVGPQLPFRQCLRR